jgi:hypothetical protein
MDTPDGGTQLLIRLQRNRDHEWIYSTEDCVRILAVHGLVMWVEPTEDVQLAKLWTGNFWLTDGKHMCATVSEDFPTQRAATEATFQAALEYILKDMP